MVNVFAYALFKAEAEEVCACFAAEYGGVFCLSSPSEEKLHRDVTFHSLPAFPMEYSSASTFKNYSPISPSMNGLNLKEGFLEKGYLLYTVDNALAECLNVIWKHATLIRDLSAEDTKTAIDYLLQTFIG